MKPHIILIGGGGHCKACIDVVESTGVYSIAGIVDTEERKGQLVCGYPIVATDEEIASLVSQYKYFLISVGQIESSERRKRIFDAVLAAGGELPLLIADSAHVSPRASVGQGTIVMHQACVNADARIGHGCIINTGAIIEHDASVGDFCHISTGAVINGGCQVGSDSFVGSNACVREKIRLGPHVVVGAGSVVVSEIGAATVVAGNPARPIKGKHG